MDRQGWSVHGAAAQPRSGFGFEIQGLGRGCQKKGGRKRAGGVTPRRAQSKYFSSQHHRNLIEERELSSQPEFLFFIYFFLQFSLKNWLLGGGHSKNVTFKKKIHPTSLSSFSYCLSKKELIHNFLVLRHKI